MDLWIDCRERTFSVLPPADLESRRVMPQTMLPTLELAVIVSNLSAMYSQSDQGIDLVYKISIAE